MKTLIARSLIVCCVVTLQSCTLNAPQLDAVVGQVRSLTASKNMPDDMLWLASFKAQGAVLKPYTVEGYTVFANEQGDAIAFDGWVIRSVLGFGLESPLRVTDDQWLRTSSDGTAQYRDTCAPWQKESKHEGYQWRQICGINGHETVIGLDDTDNIRYIRQAFGGTMGSISLSVRD